MCVAAISVHGRDLIDEQAREQRLDVGPGHRLDRFRRGWEPGNRMLLGDCWPAEPLTQQELDRSYSSANIRDGNLDSFARSALAALEGDPVVTHRAGRRVEQGLTDALEPFCGRLGEARANGAGSRDPFSLTVATSSTGP